MAKIRAARMSRIRKFVLLGLVAYLAVPAFFVVRFFMQKNETDALRAQASKLEAQYGSVEKSLIKKQVLEGVTNADRYPIELLNQVLTPLYQQSIGVRVTNVEIERKVEDTGAETAGITIKGESGSANDRPAILYNTRIKANQALKDFEWNYKVEPARGAVVPFQISGTIKPDEDAPK